MEPSPSSTPAPSETCAITIQESQATDSFFAGTKNVGTVTAKTQKRMISARKFKIVKESSSIHVPDSHRNLYFALNSPGDHPLKLQSKLFKDQHSTS